MDHSRHLESKAPHGLQWVGPMGTQHKGSWHRMHPKNGTFPLCTSMPKAAWIYPRAQSDDTVHTSMPKAERAKIEDAVHPLDWLGYTHEPKATTQFTRQCQRRKGPRSKMQFTRRISQQNEPSNPPVDLPRTSNQRSSPRDDCNLGLEQETTFWSTRQF